MMDWRNGRNSVLLSALLLSAASAVAADAKGRTYEVTVTNITKGEIFTPIMVASHGRGVKLFELGSAASGELEMLAEGGDTGPLTQALEAGGALEVVTAADGLPPGASVTLKVATNGRNRHVSVAAMLVPTNDGFFAVNGIAGPSGRAAVSVVSPAYDAGSEANDELCVSIPGPPFICAGEGYNPAGGEGYVYIHPGIQGDGDLVPSAHDWRNPVARITIRKSHR